MTPSAAQIVEALGGRGDKSRCPARDDRNASLHVTQRGDRVLVKCFAGCDQADVIAALRERGLWPDPRSDTRSWVSSDPTTGATREHFRKDTPDGKRCWWSKGGPKPARLLYVARNRGDGPIVLTEGEPAADAVGKLGIDALGTVTGASGCPDADVLAHYARGRALVLWPDADPQGADHMARVARLGVGTASISVVDPAAIGLRANGALGVLIDDGRVRFENGRLWEESAR